MQLELAFYGPYSVRTTIDRYMLRQSEDLAEGTMDDYRERRTWVFREIGENRDIRSITYDFLDALVRKNRGILRNTTVKRRLIFLVAAMKFARTRGLDVRIPELPRLKNDGMPRTSLHTVDQWQIYRTYLPKGPFRRFYDLGFWTLHHTQDLFSMQRWMLDPDKPVLDESGKEIARGMFWRRNQKNRRCEPCWINMQPEFALLSRELLSEVPPLREAPIVGRLWNLRRTLHMAADRATADGYDIPRVSPIDLRRSGASMLTGRGYPVEYARIVLGHQGETSRIQGGISTRPSIATTHYLRPTPALIARGVPEPA